MPSAGTVAGLVLGRRRIVPALALIPARRVVSSRAHRTPRAGRRPAVPLNDRQARFVAEYLVDLNATQAAIRAGYSAASARQMGAENLSKPDIQAALAEARAVRGRRTEVTADRVVLELARVAFGD